MAKPGILVTGGAGYIGSITTLALIEYGWRPVVLDNFVNSQPAVVKRIEHLTGTPVALVRADVRDASALDSRRWASRSRGHWTTTMSTWAAR